jgi:hypothetical protein
VIGRRSVVTCGYTLEERSAGAPADFHIAPETVEFHLIENIPASDEKVEQPES